MGNTNTEIFKLVFTFLTAPIMVNGTRHRVFILLTNWLEHRKLPVTFHSKEKMKKEREKKKTVLLKLNDLKYK